MKNKFVLSKFFSLFLLIMLLNISNAQTQLLTNFDEFEDFDYNIKQLDEFILRFNLKELIVKPEYTQNWKKANRILLFDRSYYLQNKSFLNKFIEDIENQKVTLNFEDTTWFAIADCDVIFKGKRNKLTLVLQPELIIDDMYKWSIVDAIGSFLELTPKTTSNELKILPTDNDVNFISLQSITTTNSLNITLYNKNNHTNDRLSVFNCLVYNKMLEIKYVENLTYCFKQVCGYEFYVKKFVREEKNAGWLIYDVKTNNYCNEVSSPQNLILELYTKLSDFSKTPYDILLKNQIKDLFFYDNNVQDLSKNKQLYNDIDVFIRKYPDHNIYMSIDEYLCKLESIIKNNLIPVYQVTDFGISYMDRNINVINYTVKLTTSDGFIDCQYQVCATIYNNKIISIDKI